MWNLDGYYCGQLRLPILGEDPAGDFPAFVRQMDVALGLDMLQNRHIGRFVGENGQSFRRIVHDKSAAMHDVKIRFTTNLRSERFDTDVEVILYRVICELINNSLKHAACSSINLSLSQNGTELALDYTDDGRGFNPQAMMDCGMGLSNISSRINSLGGVFDIASAKGRGMRAAIRVNTQEEQASQRLRRRKRK